VSSFNTKGKLVYPVPGGGTSSITPTGQIVGATVPPEKKSWWDSWGDAIHTALDVAGMVPVIGEFADGANAVIYLAEGDLANAAISGAALLPVGGQAATGARLAVKAADKAKDVVKAADRAKDVAKAADKTRDAAKAADDVKDAKKAADGADGTKVKGDKGAGDGPASICKALAAAVYAKVPEVATRLIAMMKDKHDLFNLTRKPDGTKGAPHPSLPKGSGTWHGHVQQIQQKQKSLRDSITEYDAAKCKQPKIPKSVRDLSYYPIPKKPGGTPGYPFTQLPL
jgi:hypothetical protein